jgi:hypothetical protein
MELSCKQGLTTDESSKKLHQFCFSFFANKTDLKSLSYIWDTRIWSKKTSHATVPLMLDENFDLQLTLGAPGARSAY